MSAVEPITCPTCGRPWCCTTGTPSSISAMVLCPNCYGATGEIDLECPVCGGSGLDPVSFCGCCVEPEEDPEHDEGEG